MTAVAAAIKRTMTMTVKAAAATAVITAGTAAANKYLSKHNTTLNGKPFTISSSQVMRYASIGKQILDLGRYMY
jgi:hypothetical protein